MTRIVFLLAVCAVGTLVWAGSSAGKSGAYLPCVPNKKLGVKSYGKVRVVLYCGSAKATVHMQGKTVHFSDGLCFRVPGNFEVGIGKYTSQGSPKFKAFLLNAPAFGDGTFRNQVIHFQLPGKDYLSAKNKVVIAGKRTRGTFSGKLMSGVLFNGSFTCK
jgi:hypothetical protein